MLVMAKDSNQALSTLDDTAMELARAKFGDIQDLSLMQRSALTMGKMYADRHWLGDHFEHDPEVAVTCVELAQIRKHQMVLYLQRERDLERLAIKEDVSYEEAIFLAVSRKTHQNVNRELDRLSKLGKTRTDQLIAIADNMGLHPGTVDDAVEFHVRHVLEQEGILRTEVDGEDMAPIGYGADEVYED